jgi:hypothetical protein
MHGLPLDAKWLSNPGDPVESGYAYLLLECTEILLRTTLLKIMEDGTLLQTFKDPVRLDSYFNIITNARGLKGQPLTTDSK